VAALMLRICEEPGRRAVVERGQQVPSSRPISGRVATGGVEKSSCAPFDNISALDISAQPRRPGQARAQFSPVSHLSRLARLRQEMHAAPLR
jgi:hypothetical protein